MRRLLIVACLIALVFAVYGARAARRHVDRRIFARSIREVDVVSQTGDVEVVGGRRADVVVTRAYHHALGRPSLRHNVANGVLRLASDCSRFDFGCTVRTRIEVPDTVRLRVRVDDGRVEVRRLRAAIDVDARAGTVSVTGATGPVVVRTGTGLVTLEQVQGAATVQTDDGDVVLDSVEGTMRVTTREGDVKGRDLSGDALDGAVDSGVVSVAFTQAPARVRLQTRVGGVTVRVPTGRYAVRARAEAGRVRISGIRRDTRGGRVIDVRAGSGDVAIRGQPVETGAGQSPR